MKFTKKILIFSPPFEGHLTVLRRLVLDNPENTWKVIITGWDNVPANLRGIENITTILAKSSLAETDPALWTFPRALELLDDCLEISRQFGPDLIIYDFFSIEGYFVGKLQNILTWSSIPAFIGRYDQHSYLANKLSSTPNQHAINALRNRHALTISPGDLEMVSDGLHIPGDVNLVWSYESLTPSDFRIGRHDTPFLFIGNPSQHLRKAERHNNITKTVYISFGTVVMNNIWNQQAESREAMKQFISRLVELWSSDDIRVVFVTQGKHILDNYPANWETKHDADQIDQLRNSDIFVTHAGSNSFHESLIAGTPMVAIPFFGDQPLIANTIDRLGIGINLVPDASIDTHNKRNYVGRSLADKLDKAVRRVLLDSIIYSQSIHSISLGHTNISDILRGKIPFHEGDLLFGTNVDRKQFVDDNGLSDEFTILQFKAFSEIAPSKSSLPRIVDIYHDVILNDQYYELDTMADMEQYSRHLKEYKEYLAGETDFEKMCIKGIDFFTRYYHIHFILNKYDPAVNKITKAEIRYIQANSDRLKNHVTFYRYVNGIWSPCGLSTVMNTSS